MIFFLIRMDFPKSHDLIVWEVLFTEFMMSSLDLLRRCNHFMTHWYRRYHLGPALALHKVGFLRLFGVCSVLAFDLPPLKGFLAGVSHRVPGLSDFFVLLSSPFVGYVRSCWSWTITWLSCWPVAKMSLASPPFLSALSFLPCADSVTVLHVI